ncbi:MAG: UDP-N-acetylmuramate dehydrogenase, partial [Gammaproteobacteria bacterium HGW-Gammaproteobacteria-7]
MSGYTLLENASLAGRNTFRAPARAALLADVRDPDSLAELMAFPLIRQSEILVLGQGSNLLLAGDFPGLVVCLASHGIRILEDDGESALVRAEAGATWNDLVDWSLAHGFIGLENMALIPGSVGAAPIQNIGAYGAEAGEFIAAVEAFDRSTLALRRLSAAECAFGYRDSLFKREPERWIITGVELRLSRQGTLRLDYAGIREELTAMGVEKPRAVHVAEAVSRVRTRKLPNPALLGNAGSFFKNPLIDSARADALKREHPGMPVFPGIDHGSRKLSAAWLIETS